MKIVEPGTHKKRRVRRRLFLNRDIVLPWFHGRKLVVRYSMLVGFIVPHTRQLELPLNPPLESSSASVDKSDGKLSMPLDMPGKLVNGDQHGVPTLPFHVKDK